MLVSIYHKPKLRDFFKPTWRCFDHLAAHLFGARSRRRAVGSIRQRGGSAGLGSQGLHGSMFLDPCWEYK